MREREREREILCECTINRVCSLCVCLSHTVYKCIHTYIHTFIYTYISVYINMKIKTIQKQTNKQTPTDRQRLLLVRYKYT